MPERGPRARAPGPGQHSSGVLEAVRPRQPVRGRNLDVLDLDLGLPDRAQRSLALDHLGFVAGRALLDQEAADLAVLVARPHHDDVGEAAASDPALGSVEHVRVPDSPGAGPERHRVRAVIRARSARMRRAARAGPSAAASGASAPRSRASRSTSSPARPARRGRSRGSRRRGSAPCGRVRARSGQGPGNRSRGCPRRRSRARPAGGSAATASRRAPSSRRSPAAPRRRRTGGRGAARRAARR